MKVILTDSGIADIVEIISISNQPTCLGIADEILQGISLQKIIEVYFAPQSIDLPGIVYSFLKRGYIIKLSPTDEEQQLSQICMLILVALNDSDLDEYAGFESYQEVFEGYLGFERYFNTIRTAMTTKKIPIL